MIRFGTRKRSSYASSEMEFMFSVIIEISLAFLLSYLKHRYAYEEKDSELNAFK